VAAGGRLRVRSASRPLHSQSLSPVGTLSDSSSPSLQGDRVSLQLWGDIILEQLQCSGSALTKFQRVSTFAFLLRRTGNFRFRRICPMTRRGWAALLMVAMLCTCLQTFAQDLVAPKLLPSPSALRTEIATRNLAFGTGDDPSKQAPPAHRHWS